MISIRDEIRVIRQEIVSHRTRSFWEIKIDRQNLMPTNMKSDGIAKYLLAGGDHSPSFTSERYIDYVARDKIGIEGLVSTSDRRPPDHQGCFSPTIGET